MFQKFALLRSLQNAPFTQLALRFTKVPASGSKLHEVKRQRYPQNTQCIPAVAQSEAAALIFRLS